LSNKYFLSFISFIWFFFIKEHLKPKRQFCLVSKKQVDYIRMSDF